jgi:hypothetical protein
MVAAKSLRDARLSSALIVLYRDKATRTPQPQNTRGKKAFRAGDDSSIFFSGPAEAVGGIHEKIDSLKTTTQVWF